MNNNKDLLEMLVARLDHLEAKVRLIDKEFNRDRDLFNMFDGDEYDPNDNLLAAQSHYYGTIWGSGYDNGFDEGTRDAVLKYCGGEMVRAKALLDGYVGNYKSIYDFADEILFTDYDIHKGHPLANHIEMLGFTNSLRDDYEFIEVGEFDIIVCHKLED